MGTTRAHTGMGTRIHARTHTPLAGALVPSHRQTHDVYFPNIPRNWTSDLVREMLGHTHILISYVQRIRTHACTHARTHTHTHTQLDRRPDVKC